MSSKMCMVQHFIGSRDIDVYLIEIFDLFPASQSNAIRLLLS